MYMVYANECRKKSLSKSVILYAYTTSHIHKRAKDLLHLQKYFFWSESCVSEFK